MREVFNLCGCVTCTFVNLFCVIDNNYLILLLYRDTFNNHFSFMLKALVSDQPLVFQRVVA